MYGVPSSSKGNSGKNEISKIMPPKLIRNFDYNLMIIPRKEEEDHSLIDFATDTVQPQMSTTPTVFDLIDLSSDYAVEEQRKIPTNTPSSVLTSAGEGSLVDFFKQNESLLDFDPETSTSSVSSDSLDFTPRFLTPQGFKPEGGENSVFKLNEEVYKSPKPIRDAVGLLDSDKKPILQIPSLIRYVESDNSNNLNASSFMSISNSENSINGSVDSEISILNSEYEDKYVKVDENYEDLLEEIILSKNLAKVTVQEKQWNVKDIKQLCPESDQELHKVKNIKPVITTNHVTHLPTRQILTPTITEQRHKNEDGSLKPAESKIPFWQTLMRDSGPNLTQDEQTYIDKLLNSRRIDIINRLTSKQPTEHQLMHYEPKKFYTVVVDLRNNEEEILKIGCIQKDSKVYAKKRIITSDEDKLKFTPGANIRQKEILLPQIMKRLVESRQRLDDTKNLEKRLILGGGTNNAQTKVEIPVKLNPIVLTEDCNKERLKAFKVRKEFEYIMQTGSLI